MSSSVSCESVIESAARGLFIERCTVENVTEDEIYKFKNSCVSVVGCI